MLKENQSRKVYQSDVTDEQWTLVAPLLPPAQSSPRGGRPRQVDLREVLNTIRYLHRSGCQWDMLPHDLLPKSTVYDYFAQWRDDGTWTTVSFYGPSGKHVVRTTTSGAVWRFTVPGEGIVVHQTGRIVFGDDGLEFASTFADSADTSALCAFV